MEQLKAFWTYISTPGTQMPIKDTVIFMAIVFAIIVIAPQFVQWRAYRRENPINPYESKAEKLKKKATTPKRVEPTYKDTSKYNKTNTGKKQNKK